MNRICSIALVIAVVIVVILQGGCSKQKEDVRPSVVDYTFEPLRVASAYIALTENPNAECALLIGEEAIRLTNYLEHAGIETHLKPEGIFDIVVVACREMSPESCAKVREFLANDGVLVWIMDVHDVKIGEFRAMLDSFRVEDVHLWMAGTEHWILIGHCHKAKVNLADMIDVFSRDSACEDLLNGGASTLPELFAGYVGTKADIMPAFENADNDALVRPELFISKEIPQFEWIVNGGEDSDIVKQVLSEMRSMQLVRREVVEGNIISLSAKDKKGEEAAIDKWAKAILRNPHELFVLERLDRLNRNARGFLEVGKLLMAMKCYETMVLIRPNDVSAVHNFGMCLKKLGKLDVAEKVLKRAEILLNATAQP